MMRFIEAMKRPLPSQRKKTIDTGDTFLESELFDDDDLDDMMYGMGDNDTEEDDIVDDDTIGTEEDINDILDDIGEGDMDDFGPDDDLSDNDEVEPDEELLDDEPIEDETPVLPGKVSVPDIPAPSTEIKELSKEESREADDQTAMTATAAFVKTELDETEIKEFVNGFDATIAMDEGFMTEAQLNDLREWINDDEGELFEEKFYGKNKIQMTKKSRLNQLYMISLFSTARAHKDRRWFQLQRLYKAERKLKGELHRTYKAEAKARAIRLLKRLQKSRSGILKKLGTKISSSKFANLIGGKKINSTNR